MKAWVRIYTVLLLQLLGVCAVEMKVVGYARSESYTVWEGQQLSKCDPYRMSPAEINRSAPACTQENHGEGTLIHSFWSSS